MDISKKQTAKIIFVYSILGFGVGGIVSLILVLMKKIPDQATPIFMIAIPIAVVFLIFKMMRNFNRITFDNNDLEVRSFLGNQKHFDIRTCDFDASIGGYSIYQQPFAPILYLKIMPNTGDKGHVFPLPLYSQKQIDAIIQKLLPEAE